MANLDEFILYDKDRDRQPDQCRYPGDNLHVLYDRRRCMHAAECGRASKAVFDGKREPWIAPDNADRDELIRVVLRCPTGALRALDPDGTPLADPAPEHNEITVSPDGPLYVRGTIEVHMPDGTTSTETRVALCRCGASRNKPFCDGAHSRARFHDAGGVDSDADGQALEAGTLKVNLAPDGPILLSGPHTVRAASGRPAFQGQKCALCRCGMSANKPFCDGEHARSGWRSVDGDGR